MNFMGWLNTTALGGPAKDETPSPGSWWYIEEEDRYHKIISINSGNALLGTTITTNEFDGEGKYLSDATHSISSWLQMTKHGTLQSVDAPPWGIVEELELDEETILSPLTEPVCDKCDKKKFRHFPKTKAEDHRWLCLWCMQTYDPKTFEEIGGNVGI